MYFYYRKRITGWGPERSEQHPDHQRHKFRHTGLIKIYAPYTTFHLDSLAVVYPFVDPDIIIMDEATEVTEEQFQFVTRRHKEQQDG